MHAKITVHVSPDRLFAWLSDPKNVRHWFAHLRHEADVLPDAGMTADKGSRTIRWTTDPAGRIEVSGEGQVADISLTFEEGGRPHEAPAEEESPDDAPTNAGNALRSIKSHTEAVDGGDPDMHTPGVVSKEAVEEADREIAADPEHSGTPRR
ncbi:SRPBCC family protein [Pararoseomonas indoligenes]|uniref:SRPBCC family protein n=1 Tax=Roseomonas indoligenes TaxID=2820811 RepID=A0A940S4G0_9PROT|nr:SRPBCC family protein [Pararoseomonas indoligenes]MBP0491950.1 SRPBCC family protein [Pararoseomonas indoligenes]